MPLPFHEGAVEWQAASMPCLAYIRRGNEWRMARRQLGSDGMQRRGGATISEEDTSRHAHRLELSAAAPMRRRRRVGALYCAWRVRPY